VVTIVVAPMVDLSFAGRLTLSLTFASLLISGAFTTIQHRFLSFAVLGVTMLTLGVDLTGEFAPWLKFPVAATGLRLICLSILVVMTLRRTLRPGPVTVHRVLGGIAGYLLIGYAWSFAYQLVLQRLPDALHIGGYAAEILSRQPSQLV